MSKNPFRIPAANQEFEKLSDERKELIAWIYDYARGNAAALMLGAMSAIAMQKPEATWWEIAAEVKAVMTGGGERL